MKNLVSSEWLKENSNNESLIIIDCRFNLMDKEYGKNAFNKEHIKNAQRVDLETQLSSEVRLHGGRHPLPSIEELNMTMQNLGINNESIVVAYDEGDLAGASRLWWILKYLGHKKVYVLDGGITAYKKINGKTTIETITLPKGNFKSVVKESMKVDINYVRESIHDKKVAIVDSREYKRYIGEFEPIDKKAGHIPGALNYVWTEILKDGLGIKETKELEKHFEELKSYDEVIIYCGSGITACPNSLALFEAGIDNKIYTGSFSDWISYEENEIE